MNNLTMLLGRQVPYQEKHVMQQVSIIGNMEEFGILRKTDESVVGSNCQQKIEINGNEGQDDGTAVVEFGAGRGYLTHMLADCYEMKKIFLVERRSYKLKVSIICSPEVCQILSLVMLLDCVMHTDSWLVIKSNKEILLRLLN